MNQMLPVIRPDELYPIKTVRVVMGWETPSAWAAARRRGIKDRILVFGKRHYLKGSAIIEVVEKSGAIQTSGHDQEMQKA